jgi:hypothetical protein
MRNLSNAARQLIEADHFSESAYLMSAAPVQYDISNEVREGHVARVVLITEGLGNRRNLNYYGAEAIMSAPLVFEGKPCYFNHPSESEERDIPERRVQDKFGYFKNCRVETIDGQRACTGELHFDLSEAGREAFAKACTALHYKTEFPGLDSEYVGLSIHADGDWEDRTVQWQGETLQVKYVTRFTDAVSCDLVTSPARGGRILALVESAAGAIPTREVGSMKEKLKKLMEAARSALRKADEEKDPAKKSELIAEARKQNDLFLTEASKAAYEGAEESAKGEEPKAKESAEESTAKESKGAMCAKDEKESKEDEMESKADEADDAAKDKKKMAAKKKMADKKDADDEDDNVEANRIAVKAILSESGVVVGAKRVERLSALSLREAREEIEMLAEDQRAIVKDVLKQMRVPATMQSKVMESGKDGEGVESNNQMFADCYR